MDKDQEDSSIKEYDQMIYESEEHQQIFSEQFIGSVKRNIKAAEFNRMKL